MIRMKRSIVLVAVLALLALAQAARADAVADARKFLEQDERSKEILGDMHPTTKFVKVTYVATYEEVYKGDTLQTGHFAIEMRYNWEGTFVTDGQTDLQFFFDAKGKLYEIKKIRCNGLVAPWTVSDIVLGVIRDVLKDLVKGSDNESDWNKWIDGCGDARELTLERLKWQQLLGK